MNKMFAPVACVLIMLGFVASGSALAGPRGHGGHVRFGVFVGAPIGWGYGFYGPSYYYNPYYNPYYSPYSYYPPAVAVPYSPPTYIEQGIPQAAPAPAQASPSPASYWYYCAESKSYYPYVNQCPGGWQRVSPTPPPG